MLRGFLLLVYVAVVILYGIVKLFAYAGWSWLGLRIAGHPELVARALGMGLLRWLIGLVFGVIIFLSVHAPGEQLLATYIAIYVPVRVVEWLLLSACVLPAGVRWPPNGRLPWAIGGIVLSFLTDMTSPDVLEHGHFCVGRCLC